MRQAKKNYTRQGLEDKKKCSKTLWQGVKDHIGWESTGAPTMLEVNEGTGNGTIQEPKEIVEEIKKAFKEKGRVVKKAIGEPKGNYLAEVHHLHAGNVGKFSIGPISEENVGRRLRNVAIAIHRHHKTQKSRKVKATQDITAGTPRPNRANALRGQETGRGRACPSRHLGTEYMGGLDTKPEQGDEESYDRQLRKEAGVEMKEREGGVQGPDRLNYKGGKKEGGSQCILYAMAMA